MVTITNISNNPLAVGDGRLAPGTSVTVKAVGEKERGYAARGWLRIVEEARSQKSVVSSQKPEPAKAGTQNEGDKK